MAMINYGSTITLDGDRRIGPKGLPLLGIMHEVRQHPLTYFVDLMQRYGDVVHYKLGLNPVVMLNHPRDIRHVLQDNHDNYHKSRFYEPLRPILGGGMFMSEGKTWLRQRRASRPAFQGPRFDNLASDIARATSDMLDAWQHQAATGTVFDVTEAMMKLTLDVVMRAFFSTRFTREQDNVYEALTVMLKRAEHDIWSPFPIPHHWPTPANRRYREALAELDAFIYGILDHRRRNPGEAPDDLLSMLLASQAETGRSEKLLRDQILSIALAGHETTANALAWAWYLLSRHPEVRERLQQEVDEVLGDRLPGFGDLQKLRYAKMVFEETLRLYPPVWTISRRALDDDLVGGTFVPKGTTVMLCSYAVHRREQFWTDPERFDPERFSPERVEQRPHHAYFPFGGGPRTCLGNRFALMEGPMILAMVLRRYRLDVVGTDPIEPEAMITLRPRNGVPVRVVPR